MIHAAVCPDLSLCHNRSVMLSPLKSPVATIFQSGSFKSVELLAVTDPSMSQAMVCPVAGLYQSKSDLPSPLRSGAVESPVSADADNKKPWKMRAAANDKYRKGLKETPIWNTPRPNPR